MSDVNDSKQIASSATGSDLPRVQVGQDQTHWSNQNAQTFRDLSDRETSPVADIETKMRVMTIGVADVVEHADTPSQLREQLRGPLEVARQAKVNGGSEALTRHHYEQLFEALVSSSDSQNSRGLPQSIHENLRATYESSTRPRDINWGREDNLRVMTKIALSVVGDADTPAPLRDHLRGPMAVAERAHVNGGQEPLTRQHYEPLYEALNSSSDERVENELARAFSSEVREKWLQWDGERDIGRAPEQADLDTDPITNTIEVDGDDAATPEISPPGKDSDAGDTADSSSGTEKGSGKPDEDEKTTAAVAADERTRKPIMARTGYDLPTTVAAQYVARDGKFVDRKSERVHFEDRGKKLSTTSEERRVVEHMVEVAKAKNWDHLTLKGTEEFRRQAWLAAEIAGIETRGFKPTAQDLAALQARREEMRISAGERPDRENSIGIEPEPNSPEQKNEQGKEPAPVVSDRFAGMPDQHRRAIGALRDIFKQRGDSSDLVERALDAAAKSMINERVYVGRVIEHGAAPYDHNPENNDNYYVMLETPSGEQTVWGVDLATRAEEGLLNNGEDVVLAFQGKKPVTVQTPELDERGKRTGRMKEITTHRNTWDVLEAGKLIDLARQASTDEPNAAPETASPKSKAAGPQTRLSPEQEAEFRAQATPERLAALRIELAAERAEVEEALNRRFGLSAESEPRASKPTTPLSHEEIIKKHRDPLYREAYARELLESLGLDPNKVSEVSTQPVTSGKTTNGSENNKQPISADESRASLAEPASAREAALRAVLENEMDKNGVPESERGEFRANLEASLASARASGADLGIPEPLTVDRSVQAAHSPTQAKQINHVQDGISPDLNH